MKSKAKEAMMMSKMGKKKSVYEAGTIDKTGSNYTAGTVDSAASPVGASSDKLRTNSIDYNALPVPPKKQIEGDAFFGPTEVSQGYSPIKEYLKKKKEG